MITDNIAYSTSVAELARIDYGYNYPSGLNLRPGHKLHDELVEYINRRATDSYNHVQQRHSEWRTIDDTLRAYVYEPPEWPVNGVINRKPRTSENPFEKIVLPVSYANLETLLTYMSSAFLQDPIFKYEGVGPEDVLKTMLLEKKIALDSARFKHGLALHTHWRDGFAYGFGVIAPEWTRNFGTHTVIEEKGFMHRLGNFFIPTARRRGRSRMLLYEGNRLNNVDPYRYLPDPNVAIHDVQRSEYVGYLNRDTYMSLLEGERDKKNGIFNVQYIKHISGRSQFVETRQQRPHSDKEAKVYTNKPVDVLHMYITLVPQEWELGTSVYPEKWYFAVAGDTVIVSARPVSLDHNMYPLAVCAPDYDGYSVAPPGRLTIVNALQELVDFMYSSRVMNIRKVLNDMFVVDPNIVNIFDMQNPEPGKLIRLRRSMWGRGAIDQAVKQLQVQDITQGHVGDVDYLMNFMQRVLGTTDPVQGAIVNKGPRISASQATGARQSVLSRLEKTARIIDMQSHQDLAYMMASQTQQLMDNDTFVKATGEWAQRLMEDFGIDAEQGRIRIDKFHIIAAYDVIAHTGTVPGSEDVGAWIQIMQMAGQIPEAAQMLDWGRLFKHIARQVGAKNVDDFIKRTTPQVMPDDQIAEAVRKGDAVPLEDAVAA